MTLSRSHARPPRSGSYEWRDRDDDVAAAIEPEHGHPSLVATLSVVRDDDSGQAGIYIDSDQAHEIIAWLTARLSAWRRDPRIPELLKTSSCVAHVALAFSDGSVLTVDPQTYSDIAGSHAPDAETGRPQNAPRKESHK